MLTKGLDGSTKITKAGKFVGSPIFSCITDLISALQQILSSDGAVVKQTNKNWRCTNRPEVVDTIRIPSTVPKYLPDGSPNIKSVSVKTTYDRYWCCGGTQIFPFDTLFAWNGYIFAGLYNQIPLGSYFLKWNNPQLDYIQTTSRGAAKNTLTTYTRGLNPGHYAQNYETTVSVYVSKKEVLVSAPDQHTADQRSSLVVPVYNPLPDLVIEPRDLRISNTTPITGDVIELSAVVRNMGSAFVSRAKVGFYEGGRLIAMEEVFLLPPGGSREVSILYPVSSAGLKVVDVKADPQDSIGEEDETNNQAAFAFTATQRIYLPDLVPVAMYFSPYPLVENATINTTVTVRNQGNTSLKEPVNVYLEVNSTPQYFNRLVNMDGIYEVNVSFVFNTSAGNHTVTVRVDVYDSITESNESNNMLSSVIYVTDDGTPPEVRIISPLNTTYTSGNITINVSATDSSGISSVVAQVNGTNLTLTSSDGYYVGSVVLGNGMHFLRIYANDSVGNLNATEGVHFSVNLSQPDLTPPEITFVPPTPANGFTVNANYVFINITGSEPLATALLDWNGTNLSMLCSGINCHLNMTGLSSGLYEYRAYASDASGNTNHTELRVVTVNLSVSQPDLTPPAITIHSPRNITYASRNITLTVSTSEPANVSYSLNGGAKVSLYNMSTSGSAVIEAVEGANFLEVYAVDAAGTTPTPAGLTSVSTPPCRIPSRLL
ncbi:MAG: hypothetical protein GXN98_02385 [Euryarchaeota archaeon]|nr:hypothetical protein [Euryarchaeota archaeon]